MNCPICFSENDERAYRCRACLQICSYRRLARRYRYVLLALVALIGWGGIPRIFAQWSTRKYEDLPAGALVPDAVTLSWLGLTDKGWFCEEPHYKGRLLHLRHNV